MLRNEGVIVCTLLPCFLHVSGASFSLGFVLHRTKYTQSLVMKKQYRSDDVTVKQLTQIQAQFLPPTDCIAYCMQLHRHCMLTLWLLPFLTVASTFHTYSMMLIVCLSFVGCHFLTGFYSKDTILCTMSANYSRFS